MLVRGKAPCLWARALTIVLMVMLAIASPLAHVVLPQALANQSFVHGGSKHAHPHHHGDELPIAALGAFGENSSHEACWPESNCAKLHEFCPDCSYFCHPVFDVTGEYLIENQGRPVAYSAPNAILKGVIPDVLPRPPQIG